MFKFRIGETVYPFGGDGNRVIARRRKNGRNQYVIDKVDNQDSRGRWSPYWWSESEIKGGD